MNRLTTRWRLLIAQEPGGGGLKDSPLSLWPLYSTYQAGLPSTPTWDSCQPLRIEFSHHYPHRALPKPKRSVSLPSNPIPWITWISHFNNESRNQTPSGSGFASHWTLMLIYGAAIIKQQSQVNCHFNSTRERVTLSILISGVWETLGITGLRRMRLAISWISLRMTWQTSRLCIYCSCDLSPSSTHCSSQPWAESFFWQNKPKREGPGISISVARKRKCKLSSVLFKGCRQSHRKAKFSNDCLLLLSLGFWNWGVFSSFSIAPTHCQPSTIPDAKQTIVW